MSKRIEIDGEFFRMRRGRLVKIPDEWVGNTTHPQTIRKRHSKMTRKMRRSCKFKWPHPARAGAMGYRQCEAATGALFRCDARDIAAPSRGSAYR